MKLWLLVAFVLCVSACSGGGASTAMLSSHDQPMMALTALTDDVKPFTPGVDPQPEVAVAPKARPLTPDEIAREALMSRELSDPNRASRRPLNVVGGGNGEAVGTFTPYIPKLQGMIVNMGVQLNYLVQNGGNFFHTHSGACFEFGINYAAQYPTLFGYNWCAGGNTPVGYMNIGLVGDPNGVLNTWNRTGNGWLLAWDPIMGTYKIALEEVLESNGWHLLGYDWATLKYKDIMNNHGVTGTINDWGGSDIFEVHVTPNTSCAFNSSFPVGTHLLYDMKKQVLVSGTWQTLDKIANVTSRQEIDCANITGLTEPGYTSPFFSGEYYQNPATSEFGPQHAGDWWMTQR
jgi:hypothetical protein